MAILDTIINIASFRTICQYVQHYWGIETPILRMVAQGDDVLFTTSYLQCVSAIVHMYGYKVHPEKTYISRERGEFLRSYETDRITGYISRSLLSLRYRNPTIAIPVVKAERIYPG